MRICYPENTIDEPNNSRITIDIGNLTYEYTSAPDITPEEYNSMIHILVKTIQELSNRVIAAESESNIKYLPSAIGDLPVNAEGLRKAINEITRLRREHTMLISDDKDIIIKISKLSDEEIGREMEIIQKEFESDNLMQPMSYARQTELNKRMSLLKAVLDNRRIEN